MKKSLLVIVLLALSTASIAKDVYVNGHFRKNGTYVDGYHRSSPNNNPFDNYGYQGDGNQYGKDNLCTTYGC